LVLDDLQWADEASLAVWHQLAASISQLRLLLIGTSRPAPGCAERRAVGRETARRRLDPGLARQAAPMLARRAPQLAVELLQRELETPGGGSRAGQQRLRPHGIKQGVRSRRGPRATSG
jgi:hypothetical protein